MIHSLTQGDVSLSFPKQIAHFMVSFVSSVPPRLLCSLCNELMKSPCHVNCCQKFFCQDCIGRIKQFERPCPSCGEKNFLVMSESKDFEMKAEIVALKVYCPMRKNGCKWIGKFEILDDHLLWGQPDTKENTCRVIPVKCINGCGLLIPRGTMKTHAQVTCDRRESTCEYCGVKDSHDQLTTVHYNICHKYHVTCPKGCKMPGIERMNLKSHIESECPLRTVPCEFHFAGCGDELLYIEQSRHMTQSMTSHMHLLSVFVRSLQVENKDLRNCCSRLENICVSLQRDVLRVARKQGTSVSSAAASPVVAYQNMQHHADGLQRPLPPIPAPPPAINTLVNESYIYAGVDSLSPSPDYPANMERGIEIDDLTLSDNVFPPSLPPRLYSLSENVSVSSADWLPNDSTDVSEDQMSPL